MTRQCFWCDLPYEVMCQTQKFCSRNCKGLEFYWRKKADGTGRGTARSRLKIRTCLAPNCNVRFRPVSWKHCCCSGLCATKAEYWRNHDWRLSVIRAARSKEPIKKRITETGRQYRQINKARIARYIATWRAANPEGLQARGAKYRQIKRGLMPFISGAFTGMDWIRLKLRYNHSCAYCHKRVFDLTQDHITPLSKGGEHTLQNIVPACRRCNGVKADTDVIAFLERVKIEGWTS